MPPFVAYVIHADIMPAAASTCRAAARDDDRADVDAMSLFERRRYHRRHCHDRRHYVEPAAKSQESPLCRCRRDDAEHFVAAAHARFTTREVTFMTCRDMPTFTSDARERCARDDARAAADGAAHVLPTCTRHTAKTYAKTLMFCSRSFIHESHYATINMPRAERHVY